MLWATQVSLRFCPGLAQMDYSGGVNTLPTKADIVLKR
jgi:hypothetical protein